jgi:magnesium-protoporphyrin IX monomethyl ester (oxidative) cyclase
MKILLFSPYNSFDHTAYGFYRASVPYNLLYIAGYLRKHGIESKIYELGVFDEKDNIRVGDKIRCGLSDEAITKILADENPDIVGLSTMYTVFHEDYVEAIRTIKRFNPAIRVVVGGNHASCFPGLMLESGADQVVVGEGEEAFLGVCRGDRSKIIRKAFLKDLDEIPFPPLRMIDFWRHIEVNNPYVMRTPVAGIISSRGCPNDCAYCTVNGVWKRQWRARSPGNVVLEMINMIRDYGIREFHFLDDNLMVDRKRLAEICRIIIDERLNIKWAAPAAHWALDNNLLDLMKRSGCYRLSFGIESGDLETRKFIGKSYPLAQAREIIAHANRIGLWTITTNIIGFPYETLEQINNTVNFAKTCGADFACFFLLIPHPSSRVYQYYVKEGLFNEDDRMSILNEGGCDTVHFKKDQLRWIRDYAYREFVQHRFRAYMRNPRLLLQKIHSFEDARYLWRLVNMGLGMKRRAGQKSGTSKDFIYGDRQYV